MNVTPQTPQSSLKLDAGIAPLVARLQRVPHFRLYVILQHLNLLDGNRQRITVERLYAALGALGVEYQPQRYYQLIAQGQGLFWKVGQGRRLYLVSERNAWPAMLQRLEEQGATAAELAMYCPAHRKVYVDVSGGLQAFTARLYAAWVGSRRAGMVTASRDAQGRLWGASGRTIYTYARLGGVRVTPGYVQYAGPVDDTPHRGDNIRGDVREYRVKGETRYSWQAPNTYGYINNEHHARGQQNKIRRATRRDGKQDADLRGASKRIFDAGGDVVKACKQALSNARKYGPKWSLVALGDAQHTNGRVVRYYEQRHPHSTHTMTNAGESAPRGAKISRILKTFRHSTGLGAYLHTLTPPRAATPGESAAVGQSGDAAGPPDGSSAALDAERHRREVGAYRRAALDALERLATAAAALGVVLDAERHRREVQAADTVAALLGLWRGYRLEFDGLGK